MSEHLHRNPERIEVVGERLPALREMMDKLSEMPDIRVATESQPFRPGKERADISEREMVEDLLDFCGQVKNIPRDQLDERDQALVDSVDTFVDSVRLMTHEAYHQAINGLANRQAAWLEGNGARRIRFVVQRNKTASSQGQVAQDMAAAITAAHPELAERVDVCLTERLADGLTPDTKVVLADDWAVSGNLIAQDIAHVHQVSELQGVEPRTEVNLLLARDDQIEQGIKSINDLSDTFSDHTLPDVAAYYTAPAVRSVYGYEAVPTGSHSAVDYGFSETLSSMYRLLERYGNNPEPRLPYAATIIPKYSYKYAE